MEEALHEYLERLKLAFHTFIRFGDGDDALTSDERAYKLELVDLFRQHIEASLRSLPADETLQTLIGKAPETANRSP